MKQQPGLITSVKNIAERTKWLREKRGLSQKELAQRAGVTQSTIGNVEAGLRRQPRELLALAAALQTTPQWLSSGEGGWEAFGNTDGLLNPRALGPTPAPANQTQLAVRHLAKLAAAQRPTLRKNLGNLLVDLVEHPDDEEVISQTIADIERFFSVRPK